MHASLMVLVGVVTLVYLPGHMSGDTLAQIEQVRSGHYNDFHSPILASLWHLGWVVVSGTWYVLLATVAMFVGSVFVLFRVVLTRRGAALATGAVVLSPVMFGYLGVLSRDTWFTVLTLGAFAATIRAVDSTGRKRTVAVVLSLAYVLCNDRRVVGEWNQTRWTRPDFKLTDPTQIYILYYDETARIHDGYLHLDRSGQRF